MRGHHSHRNLLEQSIIVYLLRYLTASRLTARNIQTTSQENVFSYSVIQELVDVIFSNRPYNISVTQDHICSINSIIKDSRNLCNSLNSAQLKSGTLSHFDFSSHNSIPRPTTQICTHLFCGLRVKYQSKPNQGNYTDTYTPRVWFEGKIPNETKPN